MTSFVVSSGGAGYGFFVDDQGVQRQWDPSRQPLHVGIDVRPEPRLA